MDDLSHIPDDFKVKITLPKEEWLTVLKVVASRIEAGSSTSPLGQEDEPSITMKYAVWESIFKDLTSYAVQEIEAKRIPSESFWRAKTEIGDILIGLQEERLLRMEQGEG